jgi:hypothetical protein
VDFGKVPCSSEKERDPLRGHVVRQFVNGHAVKFAAGLEKINSFLLAGEAFGHLRTLSCGILWALSHRFDRIAVGPCQRPQP